MADPEKLILQKLRPLLAELRELQVKAAAITDEIDGILGGGAGIGALMKRLEGTWDSLWRSRYGVPYMWSYTKDKPQLKRLLKGLPVEEIKARMSSYLANADPYYTKARHNFALFVGSINSHAGLPGTPELTLAAPVVGCRHTPPCTSDQQHTQRKTAEMRA